MKIFTKTKISKSIFSREPINTIYSEILLFTKELKFNNDSGHIFYNGEKGKNSSLYIKLNSTKGGIKNITLYYFYKEANGRINYSNLILELDINNVFLHENKVGVEKQRLISFLNRFRRLSLLNECISDFFHIKGECVFSDEISKLISPKLIEEKKYANLVIFVKRIRRRFNYYKNLLK